jgi:hypothetical protein
LIVDNLFIDTNEINGHTKLDYYDFIDHRIDEVVKLLGLPLNVPYLRSPIQDWFYSAIEGYQISDFFYTKSRQYTHKWRKSALGWNRQELSHD